MKSSLICLCTILGSALAQTPDAGREILAGSGTLSSGITIQYRTLAEGPGYLSDSIGGGFRIEGDRLYRLLIDRTSRFYFGYQLAVGAGQAAGAYVVTIEPVDGFEDLLRRFAPEMALRPAPQLKYPAPQVVREGDTIALDMMVSPDGRQRITDHIRLPGPNAAELMTRSVPVRFKSTANLVAVPVVVRDSQGRAIGNLEKEDFQLSDGGKPQIVSRFSVEKLSGQGDPAAPAGAMPTRFVAFVFDDRHLDFADLAIARQAAERRLPSSNLGAERIAIYTTSGQSAIDFTNDREALRKTLLGIRPRPTPTPDCPPLTFFSADLILDQHDPTALANGLAAVRVCSRTPYSREEADHMVRVAAFRALAEGDSNARRAMGVLEAVVQKMTTMPGQRSIVLVSAGFLVLDESRQDETALIDRAIRSRVVINGLDAGGLQAFRPDGDASAVMAEVADATGGRFFRGNNVDTGFELTAGTPEYMYVLGFTPQELKLDGRYHPLKVALANPKGLTLQARRGYYAPRFATDPVEQAKQQVEEAFFSTGEIRELPATMETQFFKTSHDDATIDVLAKVDAKQLPFRKEGARNRNDVTVVCGLFDENGNYLLGTQKIVELRLRDETIEARLSSGIAVRTSFDVKSGRYMVRMVVRDSEGQALTAFSRGVEIP